MRISFRIWRPRRRYEKPCNVYLQCWYVFSWLKEFWNFAREFGWSSGVGRKHLQRGCLYIKFENIIWFKYRGETWLQERKIWIIARIIIEARSLHHITTLHKIWGNLKLWLRSIEPHSPTHQNNQWHPFAMGVSHYELADRLKQKMKFPVLQSLKSRYSSCFGGCNLPPTGP